jgi:DNA-binding MarR family transcriptional regulator
MDDVFMSGGETLVLDAGLYEGLAGFRYALRRFLAFSEVVTSAAGITPQQYQALLVIKIAPGAAVMIKDLADQLLLQHHGAVQLIDRLVKAALAERRHSPTDGRSVLVAMTAKGEKLLEDLAATHVRELLKQEPLLAESLKQLRRMAR